MPGGVVQRVAHRLAQPVGIRPPRSVQPGCAPPRSLPAPPSRSGNTSGSGCRNGWALSARASNNRSSANRIKRAVSAASTAWPRAAADTPPPRPAQAASHGEGVTPFSESRARTGGRGLLAAVPVRGGQEPSIEIDAAPALPVGAAMLSLDGGGLYGSSPRGPGESRTGLRVGGRATHHRYQFSQSALPPPREGSNTIAVGVVDSIVESSTCLLCGMPLTPRSR